MNILDFTDIIISRIFDHLDIFNLVKISEVCKIFNKHAKKIKITEQEETLDYVFGFNFIHKRSKSYSFKKDSPKYKILILSF